MSSPIYKLTYFTAEAKAELIRFIFAQAEVEYQDVRIPLEDWPSLKPLTPFGHLPLLEFGGETFAGSGPIAKYVAEKHGLAGSNDVENLKIAGIKDYLDEVVLKMAREFFEKDDARKKTMKKEIAESIPQYLGTMEKKIQGNPSGWLFGTKVTYIDLYLYLTVDYMKWFNENALDGYPGVEKLVNSVANLPNIARWIESRPERTLATPVM